MKKLLCTMVCLGLAAPLFADGANQSATNQPATDMPHVSYALGMLNARSWKAQELDFDPDQYAKGIKDVLTGDHTELTFDQAEKILQAFKQQYSAKMQQKRAQMAVKGKADAEAFMTTNKLSPGIKVLSVTLPSGQTSELQYLVISNGPGRLPATSDRLSVNYRGTLLDGTEFDNSYKRGQPIKCQIGQGIIRGWSEALKNMPVGSKWKLFIPPDLAYGEQGNRGIPPNSVLIFDVELMSAEAAPPPPPPPAPLTSDIIKVPSAEDLKKGAKIEVIKPEDVQKLQQQQQTNQSQ